MSNNSTANPGSGGDSFTTTDLTAFTALSTTGKIPGSVLYVGADSSTAPTGVTDGHPFPVTVRNSTGTELALATSTKQDTGNTSLSSIDGKITACNTGAVVVSSSALPSGAATAAKQPALGTAGSASSDVLTVQGIAGGTALPVSGTFWQTTQPVSIASAVTVAQATASSLNATVVGTGTFSVQATSVPADPFGANADAASATGSISAKLRFICSTGIPVTGTVTVGTHAVTQSGTWNITTCSTVTSLTQFNGNAIDTNSGSKSAGTLRVVLATDQPALTTPMPVAPNAGTSGGATPATWVSAASTNATVVKASAGQVYSIVVINTTATIYYLKLFDKATTPTVGTDTPIQNYPIPANTSGAGFVVPIPVGMAFSNGISFALTGGIALLDSSNAATGVAINVSYK